MCSNEQLAMEFKNLKETNEKEHSQLFNKINKIDKKMDKFIDKADNTYSTKDENKAMFDLQEEKNKTFTKITEKHQQIIDKLSWLIVTGVLVTVGGAILIVLKL